MMDFFSEKNMSEKSLEKAKKKNAQDSKTRSQFEYEKDASAVVEKVEPLTRPKEVRH